MADLIDREELRERIYSRFGRNSTKVIATVEEGRVMSDWAFLEPFLNAAKAVDAAPKWIPCSERLPESNTQVLCYCRMGDFRIMEYDELDGRWYEGIHDYRKQAVTHWMPLTEPQKNGGDENG